MKMSDLTYWEKRFLQTKASQLVNTKDYEEAMQPKLNVLQHELDVELTKYYRRYSQTNDIPEDETRRILNNIGNSNWSMTLDQFKQKAIEGGHEKELDSEYFKSRIARLQNLETQFKQHTASFGEKHSKSLGNELVKQFNDSYMRTTYTTQLAKQHFTGNFAHFNEDQMKVIAGKPWKGNNFSERIWKKYRDDIPNRLMDSLLRGTLLGYPPNKITSMLHEQFTNIKKSDVHRLVISELSHVTEEATAQSYEESGIDEYEYMATLESHTCVVCAHLDGMVFKMSERKDGINYPLIHPYCRCTTVPYIKDLPDVKERWMRDSGTGKGKVINNMSYDKWQKQYGNNVTKPTAKIPKIIGINPHDSKLWPQGIRVTETLDGDKVQFENSEGMSLSSEWLKSLQEYVDDDDLLETVEYQMGNGRFGNADKYREIADWIKETKRFKENDMSSSNTASQLNKSNIEKYSAEKGIRDQGAKIFDKIFTPERRKILIQRHNYHIYRQQEVDAYNNRESKKTYDEVIAITKHDDKLQADTIKYLEKNVSNVISESRKVGFANKNDSQTFRPGGSKNVQNMVNRVLRHFPQEWSYKSALWMMQSGTSSRGFYNHSTGKIVISGQGNANRQATAYHEMGHRMEALKPEVHKVLLEFYDRRTEGYEFEKLSKVTGISGYADSEVTKTDNFLNPYMGKDYGRDATELLSMGIEGLFSGKYDLEKDREYANLILGILKTM